jgi:hypothetical protein
MTKHTSVLLLAGLTLAGLAALAADLDLSKMPPAAKKQGVTFDKDIKPIFEASCVNCHGADRPRNNLRLDTLDGVLKGSRDGKVVVAGDGLNSKLVIAVSQLNPRVIMPPPPRQPRRGGPGGTNNPPATANADGKAPPAGGAAQGPQGERRGPMGPPAKPLTPEQVGLIRAWVDQGAK